LTDSVAIPVGSISVDSQAESKIGTPPDAARKRPISVIMVSYMTGPALMEAITTTALIWPVVIIFYFSTLML